MAKRTELDSAIASIFMALAMSLVPSAFAQTKPRSTDSTSSTRLRLPPPSNKEESQLTSKNNQQLIFRMKQQEYLGDAPSEDQPTRIYSFTGEWEYQRSMDWLDLKSDINVISAERESQKPYLGIPDFYVGVRPLKNSMVQVYVGRKVESWSAFDEQWKLGIWQPIARWDYIHPETLGLTGLFLKLESEMVRFRGFATPYFLPDQGPNFELQDGKFTSNNRWFWSPQSEIGILSQPSSVYFNLDRPSEQEVIHHSGFATSLDFGRETEGPWARLAYTRKPRNQLHLGIDGQMEIFKEGRTQVTLHPEVVYHKVATFEFGVRSEEAAFWGSVTHDQPEDPNLPEDWLQSELAEIYVYGVMAEHSLDWLRIRNSKIRYAYMQIDVRENFAETNFLGTSVSSSLDRFMFERVFSLEWVQALSMKRDLGFRYGFKYLYSIPDDAGLISLKTELMVGRHLILDASADVLGASESADQAGSGLMTRYRSNDRVAVGLTYVF